MGLKQSVRVIPDYPRPGIRFLDITPLLCDPEAFHQLIDKMVAVAKDYDIDMVVGPEARGFIIGPPLAFALNAGFVPARKPGKLPCKTVDSENLQMHTDAIKPGQKVAIIDDLLATGATALETAKLVEELGGKVELIIFAMELTYLNGRNNLEGYRVESILKY